MRYIHPRCLKSYGIKAKSLVKFENRTPCSYNTVLDLKQSLYTFFVSFILKTSLYGSLVCVRFLEDVAIVPTHLSPKLVDNIVNKSWCKNKYAMAKRQKRKWFRTLLKNSIKHMIKIDQGKWGKKHKYIQ